MDQIPSRLRIISRSDLSTYRFTLIAMKLSNLHINNLVGLDCYYEQFGILFKHGFRKVSIQASN